MRVLVCAVTTILLVARTAFGATGDPAVDALVDKLVEKGLLTREDAGDVERELKRSVDERRDRQPQAPHAVAETQPLEPKSKLKLPFEIKVRAQARLDLGDLLAGPDGRYETEADLFLRRVRLEVDKELKNPPLGKELDLNLTLEADRFEQNFRNGVRRTPGNGIGLQYLYADWILSDAFGLEIGKHKLPLLRVELTSSSRQLLIERPAVTGEAKDTFGDYHQAQLMAHGGVADGVVRYFLSYADGASDLDALQDLDEEATALQRRGWGKALTARVELAPWGFGRQGELIEQKRDDTGIGGENHLTLGIDGGFQQGIRYATESVADARLDTSLISLDLSGRYSFGTRGTVTGQLEYVRFKRDFNYRTDERPQGGYLQAGYLLPFTVLSGSLEPAFRYEVFDHDRVENGGESGSRERSLSLGANHYLQKHNLKWAYNFVHTSFDRGIAQAANSRNRELHQLQLQLYF